jgi:3-hydroxybutyrate dehydrogenase
MSLKGKAALVTGDQRHWHGIASALAAEGVAIMLKGFGDAGQIEALRAGMAATYGVRVAYSGADVSRPMVADT